MLLKIINLITVLNISSCLIQHKIYIIWEKISKIMHINIIKKSQLQ